MTLGEGQEGGGGGLQVSGGAVAAGAGVGGLGLFMAQNTEDVQVSFLIWDFTSPLWLVILASAMVGALVWFGMGVLRRRRRRKARRAAR